MTPYDERLRELQARLRTTEDPSLSDDAFMDALERDRQRTHLDRLSSSLHGAFSRREVKPVERESEARELLQRKAYASQGLDEATKRAQAAAGIEDTLQGRDPSSPENQMASSWFQKYLPGVIPKELEGRLTRDAAARILPYAKEGIDIEGKRLAANAAREKEAATAASLRDVFARQYPERAQQLSDALHSYDARSLERLISDEAAKARQTAGQTFTATQNDLNRQTTLSAAGVAAATGQQKEARDEARKLESLAGPAGSVPKLGRRPTEKDSTDFGAAWALLSRVQTNTKRLADLYAAHGPARLAADPALRGEAESLVAQLQLDAKGPAMFQLGVLAGPDVAYLQRFIPEAASAGEALASLIGQATAGSRLEEALAATKRLFGSAKEQYGFSMPNDPDFEASAERFREMTRPATQSSPTSGLVPVFDVSRGSPTYGTMRLIAPDKARILAQDPTRFSLTPPRR